jgi:hypothetical protein
MSVFVATVLKSPVKVPLRLSDFYAATRGETGERDLAIEQLETLAKIPAGVTYGELRLDPS